MTKGDEFPLQVSKTVDESSSTIILGYLLLWAKGRASLHAKLSPGSKGLKF